MTQPLTSPPHSLTLEQVWPDTYARLTDCSTERIAAGREKKSDKRDRGSEAETTKGA